MTPPVSTLAPGGVFFSFWHNFLKFPAKARLLPDIFLDDEQQPSCAGTGDGAGVCYS